MRQLIAKPMNLGVLIRIIRKSHDLTQVGLSEILRCSQSSISKYEDGILEMSAMELIRLCSTLKVPYEVFERCFIDEQIAADSLPRRSTYKIKLPRQYMESCYYNMRALKPLMNYIGQEYGQETLTKYLQEELSFDPGSLYVMDTQCNDKFVKDVLKKFSVNKRDFSKYLNEKLCSFDNHGDLHLFYERSSDAFETYKRFVKKYPLYDCAVEASLLKEEDNYLDIGIRTKREHSLNELFDEYYLQYLQGLGQYAGKTPVKVKAMGRKNSQDVYRVSYAS